MENIFDHCSNNSDLLYDGVFNLWECVEDS